MNYTWSHALDEVSNGGFNSFSGHSHSGGSLQSPQIYGPSDYDVRHNLNINYVWQVPIRKVSGDTVGPRSWTDGRFPERFSTGPDYLTPLPIARCQIT